MALLTDIDIRKALNKDIVIEPFDKDFLTPIGYDFSVGDFVFSLQEGLLEKKEINVYKDGQSTKALGYNIPAKNTVQILTREALWVSKRIGGTFHSKVSLVSKGFSHISTTLDPGWYGPLLITLTNNLDNDLQIAEGAPFVTLLFYRVSSPTESFREAVYNKPEYRKDILIEQLSQQTKRYIAKIQATLNNPMALEKFAQQVRKADEPLIGYILKSRKENKQAALARITVGTSLYVLIMLTATLQFYWDKVRSLFGNIEYDSGFTGAQVAFITLLFLVLQELRTRTSEQ